MCSLHPEVSFSSEAARTECAYLERRLWLLALAFPATIIIKGKTACASVPLWVLEHSEEGDQEGTADRQSLAHEIMEAGTQCIF